MQKIYQDKIIATAFDCDRCLIDGRALAQRTLTSIECALDWMLFATVATISHPKELKI